MAVFHDSVAQIQKDAVAEYCSDDYWFLRSMKAIETHIFYGVEGEWLTGFSIGQADCPEP